MKNIICIDLTQNNQAQLAKIAELYGLSVDGLLGNKGLGFAKVWIELGGVGLVAYSTKKDKNTPIATKFLLESLGSMDSVKLEKKVEQVKVLDTDAILDKIAAYGMTSLTTEELKFLKG